MGTVVATPIAVRGKNTRPVRKQLPVFDIGVILRCHRVRQGLTQEEVASRAGLTREALSQIESGKRMSLPSLCRVSEALEVPLSAVIKEAEETDVDTLLAEANSLLGPVRKKGSTRNS
jgi:transcriptional regulator with XRE-family HTH domain